MEMIIKRFTDSDGNVSEVRKGKDYNSFRVICYDKYLHTFKDSYHASLKTACAAIKRIEKQTGKRWEAET